MKHERTYHLRDTCLKVLCEQSDKRHSGAQLPKPRFKHQAFVAGHTLYIYGGTSIPCNDLFDSALDLHSLDLSRGNHKWEKLRLKCNSKDLELVSGQCGALRDSEWFMFGGSNCDFKCNNHLWRLSLQTHEIHKIDSTGQVPPPRQSASMLLIDNWLLLYGGVNTNATEIYNTFHFFSLESRVWFKSTGNYLFLIQPRFDQSLCQQKQKIYLFGGTYRDIASQEMYLNDFYEIAATPPTSTAPSAITARRMVSHNMPEPRSGHCMEAIGDDYLLLIGGQISKQEKQSNSFDGISLVPNSWVYCLPANSWVRLVLSQFKYRTQFSCCVDENKVYIFGGLHSYSQLLNDLVQFSLPSEELSKISHPGIDCQLCDARKHLNPQPTYISSDLIQDLADNIEFPFAAVGLLVDNAMSNYATIINLHYFTAEINRQSHYFLKIEDNCKLPWTQQEFISSMVNFNMDSVQIPSGVDKKTKTAIVKDNLRRQYGDNAKLASLKLGSGFLHVSHSQNQQLVRVFLFSKSLKGNKERYTIKYFIIDKQSLNLTDPRMNTAKQEIESQYKELIDATLSKRCIKNTLFILSPKISNFMCHGEQKDLKAHEGFNDIIYGSTAHYNALEAAGYNISECVDVSLRAYLTCLYIKNQTTKITLSIKNADSTPIANQIYLERVDKLCRHKYVLELNNMIEYEFKIVEMYYLYDLRKRVNYFSNGLLIYHKNRLITRYKYKLGELIFRKIYKMQDNHNFLRLFGFIELPDHVPVNAFKTNVLHPAILHKLSARIKLIQKVFKKQLLQLEAQGPIKRIAPTKQSNEQIAQDIQENQGSRSGNVRKERQRKSHHLEEAKMERPPRPQRKRKGNPLFIGEQALQVENSAGQIQAQNNDPAPGDNFPQIFGLEEIPDKIEKNPEKSIQQQNIMSEEVQILGQEREQVCQIKILVPKAHLNGEKGQELEKEGEGESVSECKPKQLEPVVASDPMQSYAQMADPSEQTAKISFPIKIIRMTVPRRQNEPMDVQNGSRAAVLDKGLQHKQLQRNAANGFEQDLKDREYNSNQKQDQDIGKPMKQ